MAHDELLLDDLEQLPESEDAARPAASEPEDAQPSVYLGQ